MAGTKFSALFLAVLLALSGCSAFFGFNAFASLDKASVPNPARYQGSGGLSNLQADLGSQAIVNALKGDLTTVGTILNNLNTDYGVTGVLALPDQQIAAILYSSLALQSTSGDELVNNIVANVLTQSPGSLASILQSIVPADVAADINKFTNMVNGLMLTALPAYISLGNSLPGLGAPPGMNMGDVTQKATVAYLMLKVFQSATTTSPVNGEIQQMFLLVNGQPNVISANPLTPADPVSPGNMPPWLDHIYTASGAPRPV